MPNDELLGGTVVASCFYGNSEDMPDGLQRYTIILLMPKSPFYQVGVIRPKVKTVSSLGAMTFDDYVWEHTYACFYNINPAVAEYADLGGDW